MGQEVRSDRCRRGLAGTLPNKGVFATQAKLVQTASRPA